MKLDLETIEARFERAAGPLLRWKRGVCMGEMVPELAESAKDVPDLIARVRELTDALEFYADESTYEIKFKPLGKFHITNYEEIQMDAGNRARAALAKP